VNLAAQPGVRQAHAAIQQPLEVSGVMKASTPQELPERFRQGFSSGDANAIVSLYEPAGVIAPDPNHVIAGQAAIREMVVGFMAQRPQFTLHEAEAVQAGDIALVRSRWTVRTMDESGRPMEMKVSPTLVARRQPDGRWLVVIDRPLSSA
jgi:uncharacterized protein (TIGR02246 family)